MITSPSRGITYNVTQVEISMVSKMVNGGIIDIFWILFYGLVRTPYAKSRFGCKPWVKAVLAVIVTALFLRKNYYIMAGNWIYYACLFAFYMAISPESWLRWSTAVQDSPRAFPGVLALDYILRGLTHGSTVLSSAGSFVLCMWLGLQLPEPSPSQLSYPVLCLFLFVSGGFKYLAFREVGRV
jgi:hypothetical protein